jgi:integrase
MAARRLTDEYIKTLPFPPPKNGRPVYVLHWDAGRGAVTSLGLRITTGGARSWVNVARYPSGRKADGKHNPTARKVGGWPAMGLAEAREIASDWNRDIARGIDPQEKAAEEARAKQAAREAALREEARKRAGTFANLAEQYIARRAKKLRSGANIARIIRNDLIPRWGDKPVAEVSKTDVIDMVEDIAEHRGVYAAHTAFAYAHAFYAWCLEREDPRNPTLGIVASPCAALRIDKLAGKRKPRQRTLTDDEIALIWRATEGDPLTTYPLGPYVRLLLILGVRRNELAKAQWDEFDLAKGTWKLEDTRTKNEEPRLIPLPRLAVNIINALPRFSGPQLFSTTAGRGPMSNFSWLKRALDRKVGAVNGGAPITPWRFHDLRRTARSNWSALPILPVVAELMLGHRQRGIIPVYDTYTYFQEQRAGFEAWCAKLRSIVEPAPDNVIKLERA